MPKATNQPRGACATAYVGAVCCIGWAIVGWSLIHWESNNLRRFLVYLLIAVWGSAMKVVLPSVNGTMSANFLFVLIGVAEFSLPETITMASLGILFQSLWQPKTRPKFLHLAFNMASIALASSVAFKFYHLQLFKSEAVEMPLALLMAAASFFTTNTLLVAGAIAVTEWKPVWPLWRDGYFWSFPVYLLGAAAAALIDGATRWIGWQTALLILPVLYVVNNSHRLHVEKLDSARLRAERERQHANDKAAIQLRTIEALALAIEAKDGTTFEHLERVQVYAIAVGKELGLVDTDLEALHAAAILHDVGKIAVPEYIISKPGKLTPAEFAKMKIHPVVGSQILEKVQFPYPVAPLVRAHHEKWDGTGYPDGLRGEEIPLGARILTAVDCLDALASDRQYRKALPLHEAMGVLIRDSGTMFDPKVVEVLSRRYVELERMAQQKILASRPIIQTDFQVERGAAPDAGFESSAAPDPASLIRLHGILNSKRSPKPKVEDCRVLARRVLQRIHFDALGVFTEDHEAIANIYCEGQAAAAIDGLIVPMGKGLVGWVAENHMPIVNGNPSVEPGMMDRAEGRLLSSALAIPVETLNGSLVVVCLYSYARDAFHIDHLKVLRALSALNMDPTVLEEAS